MSSHEPPPEEADLQLRGVIRFLQAVLTGTSFTKYAHFLKGSVYMPSPDDERGDYTTTEILPVPGGITELSANENIFATPAHVPPPQEVLRWTPDAASPHQASPPKAVVPAACVGASNDETFIIKEQSLAPTLTASHAVHTTSRTVQTVAKQMPERGPIPAPVGIGLIACAILIGIWILAPTGSKDVSPPVQAPPAVAPSVRCEKCAFD